MALIGLLRLLTPAAAAFCLAALTFLTFRTFAFGRREYLSAPRGNAGNGIIYAFGRGMLEKESVALHRPTFAGGILYHGAIFAGLIYLFWTVLLPKTGPPLWAFRPVLLAGAAVGLALFIKRAAKTHLRRLSCPDDFFANLFVDVFLILAFLHTYVPALEPVLLCVSILLFVYIPLGKIRHCFFFFYTRFVFGLHYGRRGALPGSSREARS
jgi:hypothetical protein